jgi:hypothetical protein
MEETKTEIKSKISFSVESLLSKKDDEDDVASSDHLDDDDENITVDDDDTDGRESLSPNSAHTVIIPQPLHPSVPRLGHPQWPFAWGSLMRSASPQSEYSRRPIYCRANQIY